MKAQRGNILFLILLAVVLFAALAYAVTSSMRGGGKDVSDELAKSYAATLVQYGSLIENAVMRMIVSDNVKPEHLDFYAASISDSGLNAACASSACRVFDPAGGGVIPQKTQAKMRDTTMTAGADSEGNAKFTVQLVSVKGVGTSLPDIVLLQRGVTKKICDEVNINSGVHARGEASVSDDMGPGNSTGIQGTDFVPYGGSLTQPLPVLTADVLGDSDPRLSGKTVFCFLRSTPLSGYYVATVLYAR